MRELRTTRAAWVALAALIFATTGAAIEVGGSGLETFEARWRQLRTGLSNDDLYRLVWDLPKGGDIHNHHEYSVPMSFWMERAAALGYFTRVRISSCGESDPIQWLTLRSDSVEKLPDCERADFKRADRLVETERRDWLSALTLDPSESRDEFFDRAVRRLGDLERDPVLIADALLIAQKQLQAENAIYLETQADPRGFVGLTQDEGAAVLRQRLEQPDSVSTGVAVRLQVSTVRFLPGAEADLRDGFAFVHRNRDLWVGTNLVGREDDERGRPARFAGVLRELRRQYPEVELSFHAGESRTGDGHVAETIAMGATRIGHATNAYLDPRALALLSDGRHLVEVSLISSQSLGYVPDLRLHPFPGYLRRGIPVCLNTDDRGMMQANLTDEYFAAVALFDLSWAEVAQIGRWSLAFSFAESGLKKELLDRYERNLAAFERKYSAGDWAKRLAEVKPQPSVSTVGLMKMRSNER